MSLKSYSAKCTLTCATEFTDIKGCAGTAVLTVDQLSYKILFLNIIQFAPRWDFKNVKKRLKI